MSKFIAQYEHILSAIVFMLLFAVLFYFAPRLLSFLVKDAFNYSAVIVQEKTINLSPTPLKRLVLQGWSKK